ncbi:MAG: EAL domain-containing protein [Ilumatobacteraceae bacterium]
MSALIEETPPRDPLTGLCTYSKFFEHTQQALELTTTPTDSTAVFSIDLDQFRYINEDRGHAGGDAVLIAVADRLRTCLREYDLTTGRTSTICRVGGDQFLVMCKNVDDPAVAEVAAVMLKAIAAPIELRSGHVLVNARVGIKIAEANSDAQGMILDAETAQHHARHLEGNRVTIFTAELRSLRKKPESGLVEAMQRALVAKEFRLVYQPKISLTTNRIVGVEALLRWDRANVGVVMPGEFIPAAELSGVIVPIGEWVLRESFRQAAEWHQAYPRTPVHISVNVSARQFQSGLVAMIRELLAETGISANTVCLEVTETTIMNDISGAIAILDELKALGFKISIDDYGTGYSSLEYLHRMPIDELKIDRSFVAGLGDNAISAAIVASIISLAQTMNQEVVAEGVETREQLERIRTMGCDFAQGFLIAQPVSPSEINGYLKAHAAGQTMLSSSPAGGDAMFAPWIADSVLIIDDAADVRMLARMCLTAASFTVEEAETAARGLELASRQPPACVLLDVGLPDTSGTEVCRVLRAGATTADCTIVMLTGHSDRVDKADAFLAGADDYIVKPFTPRELVARVRSAIDRRRTMVQTMGRSVDTALLEMLRTIRDQGVDDTVLHDDDNLTGRQIEILRRMLGGQRVSEVADELFLSQSTVRNHLSAIYQRFGVHSQTQLLNLLRKRSASA